MASRPPTPSSHKPLNGGRGARGDHLLFWVALRGDHPIVHQCSSAVCLRVDFGIERTERFSLWSDSTVTATARQLQAVGRYRGLRTAHSKPVIDDQGKMIKISTRQDPNHFCCIQNDGKNDQRSLQGIPERTNSVVELSSLPADVASHFFHATAHSIPNTNRIQLRI